MERRQLAPFALAAALTASGSAFPTQCRAKDAIELTANEVSLVINDKAWAIVDTRPTDAYNGWKLDGINSILRANMTNWQLKY